MAVSVSWFGSAWTQTKNFKKKCDFNFLNPILFIFQTHCQKILFYIDFHGSRQNSIAGNVLNANGLDKSDEWIVPDKKMTRQQSITQVQLGGVFTAWNLCKSIRVQLMSESQMRLKIWDIDFFLPRAWTEIIWNSNGNHHFFIALYKRKATFETTAKKQQLTSSHLSKS